MTINGPAPMILAFFMNAAIDQECEKVIRERSLEPEIEKKISEMYSAKGLLRPLYKHGDGSVDLPDGNKGLGLLLLGVTGDKVCHRMYMLNAGSEHCRTYEVRFRPIFSKKTRHRTRAFSQQSLHCE